MRWTRLGPVTLALSASIASCSSQDELNAAADAGASGLSTCTTVDHEAAGGQIRVVGYDPHLLVAASFYRQPPFYVPRLGCNEACEVRAGDVLFDAGIPVSDSAGDLVVTGVGTSSVVLAAPAGEPAEYYDSSPGLDLHDGAALMVQALGDPTGVPAFSASVLAPPRATMSAPGLGSTPAPRGQPLTLTWSTTSSAAPDAVLVVRFRGDAPSGSTPSAYAVRCEYPVQDGQGEIPAYVLSLFDTGDLELTIMSEASTHVSAGSYDVWLSAVQSRGEVKRTLQLQ